MSFLLRCASVSLSLSFVPLPAIADDAVQILGTGLYHGDEVSAESGPDWWGIFPEGEGFALQAAPVTITAARDEIIDGEGEATGKMVAVPQEAEAVLLIHGRKDLKEGTLPSVDPSQFSSFIYPGQSIYLAMTGVEQPEYVRLTALGEAKEVAEQPWPAIRNYSIKLYLGSGEGSRVQTLATFPELDGDGQPRVVWAGDLDRDGKVDLLLNLTDHYNVSHLTLFLSSAAKKGELVGKVAELRTTGC